MLFPSALLLLLLQGSDCGSWLSIPYCLAFLFLVAFIMLNLLM